MIYVKVYNSIIYEEAENYLIEFTSKIEKDDLWGFKHYNFFRNLSYLELSSSLKHCKKEFSYFELSVNLELLDFALQIQQPSTDLNTLGLW